MLKQNHNSIFTLSDGLTHGSGRKKKCRSPARPKQSGHLPGQSMARLHMEVRRVALSDHSLRCGASEGRDLIAPFICVYDCARYRCKLGARCLNRCTSCRSRRAGTSYRSRRAGTNCVGGMPAAALFRREAPQLFLLHVSGQSRASHVSRRVSHPCRTRVTPLQARRANRGCCGPSFGCELQVPMEMSQTCPTIRGCQMQTWII